MPRLSLGAPLPRGYQPGTRLPFSPENSAPQGDTLVVGFLCGAAGVMKKSSSHPSIHSRLIRVTQDAQISKIMESDTLSILAQRENIEWRLIYHTQVNLHTTHRLLFRI